MKKRLFAAIVFCFQIAFYGYSQSGNLALYNMERVPQSNQLNPAKFPKNASGYFSFPSMDISLSSPLAYSDVIERRSNDSLYINLNTALSELHKNNKLAMDMNVPILGFGFAFEKLHITFSLNARASMSMMFPKDVVNFIANGNAPYLGKSAYFLPENFMGATAWTEIALGAGYQINDKLSVGIKPKALFGAANIHTGNSYLSFYTSESGDMVRVDGLVDINASSPEDVSSLFGNTGFSIDMGGIYKINDKFEVAASVVDLGFISWDKKNNTAYKTRSGVGSYEFYGFEWDELWSEEDGINENFLEAIVDTLKNMMQIDTLKGIAKYSTMLPVSLYFNGSYRINEMFKVNAMYRMQIMNKTTYSTFAVSANYYSGEWFEASIGNSIIGKSFFNPGIGVSASLGTVFQIFGLADFSSFNVAKAKSFNFQFGINLLFGAKKKKHSSKSTHDIIIIETD